MEKAIICDKLVKNFEVTEKGKGLSGSISSLIKPKKKVVKALKGVSFSIEEGELVGFIGPNGAGKTTTLKVLSGLLYPTAGFVQVMGYYPWDRNHDFLKKISLVMGQKNQLWWDLPAIDSFELNKEIYEIPKKEYERNLEELVSLLEVKHFLNVQVRRLSLGQRMRLELIAALLHHPKVLFLDEPTVGLDIIAQAKIKNFISDYNRLNKATILLTSHNMNDVLDLAKRLIVVNEGMIIFDGQIKELVSRFAKKKLIKVYLAKETDIKKMEKIGQIRKLALPEVVIAVPREASAVAAAEVLQDFPVVDINIEEEPIENIIRRIFKSAIKTKATFSKKEAKR